LAKPGVFCRVALGLALPTFAGRFVWSGAATCPGDVASAEADAAASTEVACCLR
jgi:hypothetical protein